MLPEDGLFLEKDGVWYFLLGGWQFLDALVSLLGECRGWICLLACWLHYYYHYQPNPLLSRRLYRITLLPLPRQTLKIPNPPINNLYSACKC